MTRKESPETFFIISNLSPPRTAILSTKVPSRPLSTPAFKQWKAPLPERRYEYSPRVVPTGGMVGAGGMGCVRQQPGRGLITTYFIFRVTPCCLPLQPCFPPSQGLGVTPPTYMIKSYFRLQMSFALPQSQSSPCLLPPKGREKSSVLSVWESPYVATWEVAAGLGQ